MSDELKPCPFCGGKAFVEKYWNGVMNMVSCGNCFYECMFPVWNTRSIEDDLQAELAALKEANRWIPVSERMPEDDAPDTERYESEGVWNERHYCRIELEPDNILFDTATYDHNNCEWFVAYDGEKIAVNVTHWRPLPEPPEVSNE